MRVCPVGAHVRSSHAWQGKTAENQTDQDPPASTATSKRARTPATFANTKLKCLAPSTLQHHHTHRHQLQAENDPIGSKRTWRRADDNLRGREQLSDRSSQIATRARSNDTPGPRQARERPVRSAQIECRCAARMRQDTQTRLGIAPASTASVRVGRSQWRAHAAMPHDQPPAPACRHAGRQAARQAARQAHDARDQPELAHHHQSQPIAATQHNCIQ